MTSGKRSGRALASGARNRATAALRANPLRASLPVPLRGVVEHIGRREVTGVVFAAAKDGPVRVTLLLNRTPLTETWASEPREADHPERGRGFRFGLRDVWHYAGPADALSVQVDGHRLPIAGHRGSVHRPRRSGEFSATELAEQLEDGYVFGQTGRLQLPKDDDTAWQGVVLGLYDRVRTIVRERFGHDIFLVYGSLLGAVREGGFISHDMDFDAAYVSRHRDAPSVLAELAEIADGLHEAGLSVRSHASGLKVSEPGGGAAIDLFHLYFEGSDDLLKFAFGIAGTTEIRAQSWRGTEPFALAGREVLVPVDAEALVEHMYGAGWRSPNPGFDWKRDRTTRHNPAIVPTRQSELVRWNNAYLHAPSDEPSAFARELLTRTDLPRAVADIGCGDGRDSIAFAAAGRRVLGVDVSSRGVAYARGRADALDLRAARFEVADAADTADLEPAIDALRAAGPVLFYVRFVLHGLRERDADALLTSLAALARPGDVLALEFRTTADTSKISWRKYFRRLVDTAGLRAALAARFGFEPFEVVEGTGLSPIDGEDPHLARILARRS